MKKITLSLMIIFLSLTFQTTTSNAATTFSKVAVTNSTEAKNLLNRLNEINSMDKSKLNSSDKKKLRTEVLAIKSYFNPLGGGVYISVGALIIIVLLLIILL